MQWALSHIPCKVVDGSIRQETMCRVIFNQVDVVRLASGYPRKMVLFMTAGSSAYSNMTTLSITSAGSESDLGWYDTDPCSRALVLYVTLLE